MRGPLLVPSTPSVQHFISPLLINIYTLWGSVIVAFAYFPCWSNSLWKASFSRLAFFCSTSSCLREWFKGLQDEFVLLQPLWIVWKSQLDFMPGTVLDTFPGLALGSLMATFARELLLFPFNRKEEIVPQSPALGIKLRSIWAKILSALP